MKIEHDKIVIRKKQKWRKRGKWNITEVGGGGREIKQVQTSD